jgi:hypothetical protein
MADVRESGDEPVVALLAHRAHVESRIARYQMLCRLPRTADMAFELAML